VGSIQKARRRCSRCETRGTFLHKDFVPVDLAGLELRDCGIATVGTAESRAYAEAAFGEVEAVADGASNAVVLDPTEVRLVDAALIHEVFDKAPDGVVGECGDDAGAQTEAALEAAGDIVFPAAFPGLEGAGGCDAPNAGVEAEHDFTEGDEVPLGRLFGF